VKLPLATYKRVLSPFLNAFARTLGLEAQCKFQPTCSEFAATAISVHGAVRGSALAVARVCRCHPWSRGGLDPVPFPKTSHSSSFAR
jgi:uncharacterized protein